MKTFDVDVATRNLASELALGSNAEVLLILKTMLQQAYDAGMKDAYAAGQKASSSSIQATD